MWYVDKNGEHIPVADFEKGLDYIQDGIAEGCEDVFTWVICYKPKIIAQ